MRSEEVGRLVIVMGVGFGLGMLACFCPPAAMFQRIGQGSVVIALLVLLLNALDWLVDRVVRSLGLYRLFLEFMWERRSR